MGAPVGNTNATRQKRLFSKALLRALSQNPVRLEGLVEKLIGWAEAGESWAFCELLNRLDGKAPQPIVGGDDEDNPITVKEILIRAVDATRDRPPQEGG